MGVAICSHVSKDERCEWNYFQRDNESRTSEDEEDTGHDSDSLNLLKCMSFPRRTNYANVSLGKRAISEQVRSRSYSLPDKMKDWHQSPEVNREAELQAERYSNMVKSETMKHLSDTVRTADSIVGKSYAIRNELARQGHVLSKAESDVCIIEKDIYHNSGTLRRMSAKICKHRNVTPKKDVNLKSCKEGEGLPTFDKTEYKSSSLSKGTSDDLQQTQIRAVIGKLNSAMDTIIEHQIDIASELNTQEGRLTRFENRVGNADENINRHTNTIKTIMRGVVI